MFPNEQHPGSLDDDRRRLSRVLSGPSAAVYRPLHWPPAVDPPPANGVTSRRDDDVTSGSRRDLAPPPAPLAKLARDCVEYLQGPSISAGEPMS